MADIAQKQYDYYNQNYKPFEDNLLAQANASPLANLGKAQAAFAAGNAMQSGIQDRATQRYGVGLTDSQQLSQGRMAGLNTAASTAKGTTDFAANAVNQNTALKGQMAGVGTSAISQATTGLGAANSNYMAQQQQYQQAVAAQNAANMGSRNALIGTGASLAMMSDVTLKTDIATIPDALGKVAGLTGVTWAWNEAAADYFLTGDSAGIIAQDLQQVMPEAVKTTGEHLSVNYTAVIGLLVNAVNDLHKELRELKGTN
jgi:hypothetical protein